MLGVKAGRGRGEGAARPDNITQAVIGRSSRTFALPTTARSSSFLSMPCRSQPTFGRAVPETKSARSAGLMNLSAKFKRFESQLRLEPTHARARPCYITGGEHTFTLSSWWNAQKVMQSANMRLVASSFVLPPLVLCLCSAVVPARPLNSSILSSLPLFSCHLCFLERP